MNIISRVLLLTVMSAALSSCVAGPPIVNPPEGTYTHARFEVVAEGVSEPVDGAVVTPGFFRLIGTSALLGRFVVNEDFAGPSRVAVISHRYWVDRFRSQPTAIGSRVQVDGRDTTIVGVAPPHFRTTKDTRLWIPQRI